MFWRNFIVNKRKDGWKPGVKLLIVIIVSLEFFVGRHHLGGIAWRSFNLNLKIWISFFFWLEGGGRWHAPDPCTFLLNYKEYLTTPLYWPLSIFCLLEHFYYYYYYYYFIITLGIHLQYSYTVLTYNKTTKFTYVTALLLTCLLLTYIKIPKTSLQQTKGLLKTINKWKEKKRKKEKRRLLCQKRVLAITTWDNIDNNC